MGLTVNDDFDTLEQLSRCADRVRAETAKGLLEYGAAVRANERNKYIKRIVLLDLIRENAANELLTDAAFRAFVLRSIA